MVLIHLEFDNLKRKFLDNIKNAKLDFAAELYNYLSQYLAERNLKFKTDNLLIGDRYNDFNILKYLIIYNYREKCGEDVTTQKISSSKDYFDNLATSYIYSSISEGCNYNSLYGGAYNQKLYNYFYYKDFGIRFVFNKFNWDIIRVSKLNIAHFMYETFIKVIPYLYNKLVNLIYNKLEISQNEYSIKLYKLYSIDDIKNKFYYTANLDRLEYKLEPFVSLITNKIINIETGDILDRSEDISSQSAQQSYNYSIISSNGGFSIIPLKNVILTNQNGYKSEGKAYDYGYNHFPSLINLSNETSSTEDKNPVTKESTFDKIIPPGYMCNTVVIGNLLNYLYLQIIDRETNKPFIIQFNRFGTKPGIIYSASSIKMVSSYNRKNTNRLVDNSVVQEKESYESSINDNLNKLIIDSYKKVIQEEVLHHTLVNSGLAKDSPLEPNSNNIAMIAARIRINKTLDIGYIISKSLAPNPETQRYELPPNSSLFTLEIKFLDDYKFNSILEYLHMSSETQLEKLRRVYSTLLTINFSDYFNLPTEEEFNKSNLVWYLDEELAKCDVKANRKHRSYSTQALIKHNALIQVKQYMLPLINVIMNDTICPIIKDFNSSPYLVKAYESYIKLQEVTNKIRKKKKEKYSDYSLDDLSQFATEAGYFDENLKLNTIDLLHFYK